MDTVQFNMRSMAHFFFNKCDDFLLAIRHLATRNSQSVPGFFSRRLGRQDVGIAEWFLEIAAVSHRASLDRSNIAEFKKISSDQQSGFS